jgi:acyl-CoA synthetase (AMP-forming)/AMP-acid ligase II
MDESGKQVEPGRRGELVAQGANVMRGYWNNSEETALAFRDGLFRTGDVGYQDASGYFYVLDRLKDMIVTGGEMFTPARSRRLFTRIRRFAQRRSSESTICSGANW